MLLLVGVLPLVAQRWPGTGAPTHSLPTMRIASPGCRPVAVPAMCSVVCPVAKPLATARCTPNAFHSTRAMIAATVSKVSASSPGAGTLCTRVPTGMVTGAAAAAGWPGADSNVNARPVLAATPGAGW